MADIHSLPRIASGLSHLPRHLNMRHQIPAVSLLLIFVNMDSSCARSYPIGPQNASVTSEPKPMIQEPAKVQDPTTLCSRISDIKILPQKGETGEDQTYDAFIRAGEKVVPCLIERVSDTTKMRDPRQEPGYPDIQVRIGDIA